LQGNVYRSLKVELDDTSPVVNSEILTAEQKLQNIQIPYGVLVLRNVFTSEECDKMIQAAEMYGFEDLSHIYPPAYRNNDRVMVEDTEFVSHWYHRMESYIIPYIESLDNPCKNPLGPVQRMNNRLRICKYTKNGIFGQHRDASVSYDGMQSHFTVMAYLNDIDVSQGGATRFFTDSDPETPQFSVQPEKGLVVIFPHHYLHDGELCLAASKYIIRSDILFSK